MDNDGCLFCKQDYDWGKEWLFSSEFESFFHPSCLEDQDVNDMRAKIIREEVRYDLV